MNLPLTYLPRPEIALALLSGLPFWFCSRHNSSEGNDLAIIQKHVVLRFYCEVFQR